jgi:hypothetical protein
MFACSFSFLICVVKLGIDPQLQHNFYAKKRA